MSDPAIPAGLSPFRAHDAIVSGVGRILSPGGEFPLGSKGISVAHNAVYDTQLAACLAIMGIPLRDTAPFTDDAGLDESGNEQSRRKCWWLGACDPDNVYRTEEIAEAWTHFATFSAAHPQHPLVHMRAAIDARTWWITALQAWRSNRAILPLDPPPGRVAWFHTDSLAAAAILKASGFEPLAFNRNTFLLAPTREPDRARADDILLAAAQAEGNTPPMWMSRVLRLLTQMLDVTKAKSTILRQTFEGDTTVLLHHEATGKTRDKFLKLT